MFGRLKSWPATQATTKFQKYGKSSKSYQSN